MRFHTNWSGLLLLAGACAWTGCATTQESLTYGTVAPLTAIEQLLSEHARRGFSGVVAVVVAGEPVLVRGYGLANRAIGLANDADTPIQIGSVGKLMTAAAILELQRQGHLHVQDPITRFLEGVPADKRTITIEQLLVHGSGLADRAAACSSDTAAMDRAAYVRQVLAAPLRSPAGHYYGYSNDGYGLLGAIIEAASGRAYDEWLAQAVFKPAGMDATGYGLSEAAMAQAAIGYRDRRMFLGNLDPRFRNATGPAWCNRASGGLVSTARDMARWLVALRDVRVVDPVSMATMLVPRLADPQDRDRYQGYGWSLTRTARGTRLASHSGSLSEFYTADLHWYVDEDVGLFVAANTAEHPADGLASAIVARLFVPPHRSR